MHTNVSAVMHPFTCTKGNTLIFIIRLTTINFSVVQCYFRLIAILIFKTERGKSVLSKIAFTIDGIATTN